MAIRPPLISVLYAVFIYTSTHI